MDVLQKYKNKKIAIYGMGKTGISVAKALKNIEIYCWDDNLKIRKRIRNSNVVIKKFWLNINLIDYIFISPGIDINKCKLRKYLKTNSKKIITDLDLFFELNKNIPIISITGTNGKSTTCKIIEKILKTAKYNAVTLGNIGNPILNFKKNKKNYIFILEVSSYQLEYSKLFRSKHAAILNISTDHLDRHKTLNNYKRIKSKIFFAQNKSDYSYINSDNIHTKSIKKIIKRLNLKSKVITVDKSNCSFLLKKINNKYFKTGGNVENLAFAYQIVKNFKISDKVIVKALNQFKGLPHRQEIVFSNDRLICVNDSKATSFDACLQSLKNYNNIYWIVGGTPKDKDIFNLNNISDKITKAYIIGKNTPFFVKQIKKYISYEISYSIKNALSSIFNDIKNKVDHSYTVLLSPAASSFDQFSNFEERGNQFKILLLKNLRKKLHA